MSLFLVKYFLSCVETTSYNLISWLSANFCILSLMQRYQVYATLTKFHNFWEKKKFGLQKKCPVRQKCQSELKFTENVEKGIQHIYNPFSNMLSMKVFVCWENVRFQWCFSHYDKTSTTRSHEAACIPIILLIN